MDFIREIYRLMGNDELSIATEAEDITGEVKSATSNITGNNENNGEIDTNTDDILGLKESSNSDKNNDDNNDEDNNNSNDSSSEEEEGDSNSENEEMNEFESSNDEVEESMDEKEDPFSFSRKKKLWKDFRTFHKVIDDSISLITKYVPNISDAHTIKTLDSIKNNLIEAKSLIFRTLTEEFQTLSYPELQKRFTGINHIYDICTRELEIYFDKYRDQNK